VEAEAGEIVTLDTATADREIMVEVGIQCRPDLPE